MCEVIMNNLKSGCCCCNLRFIILSLTIISMMLNLRPAVALTFTSSFRRMIPQRQQQLHFLNLNAFDNSKSLIRRIPTLHHSTTSIDDGETTTTTKMLNLHTITVAELSDILEGWKVPTYRAGQILHWVREKGVTDFDEMNNLPKSLRSLLHQHASCGSLEVAVEWNSKDGTKKRAYRLWDGQLIESVLMP